jgi:hypothetical protein
MFVVVSSERTQRRSLAVSHAPRDAAAIFGQGIHPAGATPSGVRRAVLEVVPAEVFKWTQTLTKSYLTRGRMPHETEHQLLACYRLPSIGGLKMA